MSWFNTSDNNPDPDEAAAEAAALAIRLKLGVKSPAYRRHTLEKVEADYRLWLHVLMPKHFRSADEHQFGPHHDQFFRWGWQIQRGKLPTPPACLWIVNRGGNKSTSAAGLAVALGALQRRKFGLVITRTETQGDTHIRRVGSMLLGSEVGKYYPDMARPQVREINKRNVQSAWNRTQLTTDAGWTLQSFSLQAAQRGVGLEEYRPDFLWLSDIDDERDGIGMVDTLLNAFAASVLGTRSADCVTIFDQNLIHRDSVLNRIRTRKTDVLSDRLTIGPVPAVQQPQYERRNDRWYITLGQASWDGLNLPSCEAILNTVGMDAWEREYQHNVNLAYADSVYGMWSEPYHIITRSEFAAYFERHHLPCHDEHGNWRLPARGRIVMAQDWGNNPNHPCANRWAWRPPEGFGHEVAGDVFFYRERCWPRYPAVENDDRKHPSPMTVGQAIQDIEAPWDEAGRLADGSLRMEWRVASHERPEIVRGYLVDLPMTGRPPLAFAQINTSRARDGILRMRDFLTVDESKPHPFRSYPAGHPDAGLPLKGKPRVFFVVADEQGALYWDTDTSQLAVKPAYDEEGQARTRFEYPNFRKPDTEAGAERRDPPKIDDDMIDCDRAIAGDLFPTIQAMSQTERIESQIPEEFSWEAVQAAQGDQYGVLAMGRYQQYHEIKRRLESQEQTGLNPYEQARREPS